MRNVQKNSFLTKNAPAAVDAQSINAMLKFRPATEAELKAIGDDLPAGYVAGWASTPDLDSYQHVVKSGAFSESISKRGLTGPASVKFLHGHDRDKVIGVVKVLEDRGGSLWIEAQINLGISYAKDLYEALKMTGGMNFSVGFFLEDYSFKQTDDKVEYLLIEKGDLFEVSIVPFPGNSECAMTFVKTLEDDKAPTTIAEFEKALVSAGLAKSRNDAQRITLAVKASLNVFKSKSLEDDDELSTPPAPTLPVLAAKDYNTLLEHVAKMRAVLTGTKT